MTQWTLPSALDSVAEARRLVTQTVAAHPRIDDMVLVTSELVTNAVRHGTGPVTLTAEPRGPAIRISVSAQSSGEPEVRTADAMDAGGRGLSIVEALATSWGWHRDGDHVRVWAEFDAH